jgi:hypothetical protein
MSARFTCFALALALLQVGTAKAQTRRTIGFESDCDGRAIELAPGESRELEADFYAPCGLLQLTSGGSVGKQQLVRPALPLAGISGEVALAGALTVGSTVSLAPLVIVFSPAVKEVSFDALDLDNATGLQVIVSGPSNTTLTNVKPTVSDRRARFTYTSSTPILSVTVRYEPAPGPLPDGWFIDAVDYTATGGCGDGMRDMAAGEVCDDGNRVQCDGCDNTCQPDIEGCLDGTRCVAPDEPSGCSFCDLSQPAEPGGDVLASYRPANTLCDDGLFCTVEDKCDGAGRCASKPNVCDDGAVCTTDRCDEEVDECTSQTVTSWCLIARECYRDREGNPDNACEFCLSASAADAWSARPEGHQCGDPSCREGVETSAARCDGEGRCAPAEQTECERVRCVGEQSCDGSCDAEHPCARADHCELEASKCVPDRALGEPCTESSQCPSDNCVDGVCCESTCSGACEACDRPQSAGRCTPLPALSLDPEGRCGAGTLCSAEGECVQAPAPSAPSGARCTNAASCTRDGRAGYCVDGTCCDRACDGTCEACDVPGKLGVCTPHPLDSDPERECGSAGVCGGGSACVQYETRGSGLCTSRPRPRGDTPATALLAFVALALTLARRRTSPRARTRFRP